MICRFCAIPKCVLILKWEFEIATTENTANGNKSKCTFESHKWCCRIVCIWILAHLHVLADIFVFFFAAAFDRKQTMFHETSKIDWFIYTSAGFYCHFLSNVCLFRVNIWTLVFHTAHIHAAECRMAISFVLATHYLAFTKRNKIENIVLKIKLINVLLLMVVDLLAYAFNIIAPLVCLTFALELITQCYHYIMYNSWLVMDRILCWVVWCQTTKDIRFNCFKNNRFGGWRGVGMDRRRRRIEI